MGNSKDAILKQKISQESSHGKKAVNTPGTHEAPNAEATRTKESSNNVPHIDLMEQVVSRDNLTKALHRVERNKGAPGVDGIKVENLRVFLKENWGKIREELLKGEYQPQPVLRVEIPKPNGGVRLLGIPTVLDRLIQQAILQVLTPIFDPTFSGSSYGFRPKRSAHQAVRQAQKHVNDGYRYVVDIDLEKFFDRVNHDILMARISRKVQDKRVLKMIRKYLQAGVMVNGCCLTSEEGTPQGGPLSPLLANITLHDLDEELTRRKHRFVRYADDCNIYLRSMRAAERVKESISEFIEGKLKLKVNSEKSAADKAARRKILGFRISPEKEARIWIAPQTVRRFKDRVRELTRKNRSQSMEERIDKLNRYLIGWINYYSLADTRSILKDLDGWIRRRLRACYWKQWKRPKTRLRNLTSLGIPPDWAISAANTGKGYWRAVSLPPVQKALGLGFWENAGLKSLTTKYDERRCAL